MVLPSLFNRSHYSCLKSTLSIQDIVDHAVKFQHKYVVISEFENAHSWISFYKKAKEKSLIPVFALQIKYENSEWLLVAKNKDGYKNLISVATFKKIENLTGIILILLTGEDVIEHSEKYIANSSEPNGVYVRENKFLNEEDYEFFCLLRAIDNNTDLDTELSANEIYRNDYLDFEDKNSISQHLVKNLFEILEKCEDYSVLDNLNTLNFFENASKQLSDEVFSEFEKLKFNSEKLRQKYRLRLEKEISIISEKGFCEYFLVVSDVINWAKKNDICIGPGRGSICGSLVAFVLKITEIDPIKYDLYFERFLNVHRTNIPDIDIDIASDQRDIVFDYLKEKYGKENVSLISTFQTFKIKNSFREVARALKISKEEIDFHSKFLSSLDQVNSPSEKFFNQRPLLKKFINRIIGIPKALSIHAAGVVISSISLKNLIPLLLDKTDVTQWGYLDLKELGFIKFDFLALNYLTVFNNIRKKVELDKKKKINFFNLDLNDSRVYETLIKGKNAFIFQFENPKVQHLITQFKPNSLLDLSLISAINRPGASEQIPILIARRYLDKSNVDKNIIFEILKDTYGLLIYQEQLMKIVSIFTGCSFGSADTFRRDLSVDSESCKKFFFEKALEKYDQKILNEIWDLISKFAKYSFNKSHSVAYSLISYRLLWLKTYYPEFFYSELLNFSLSDEYLFEMQRSAFSLSVPTYGKSHFSEFRAINKVFYFPVSKIVGIAPDLEANYSKITGTEKNTIDALKECIKAQISKDTLKLLIQCGFFNALDKEWESEWYWLHNLDSIYDSVVFLDEEGNSVFDLNLVDVLITPNMKKDSIALKKTLLGVDLYKNKIPITFFKKNKNIFPAYTLSDGGNSIRWYIGFLIYFKSSKTYKDIPFLWIRLSDSFYTSPDIAYFGDDVESIKNAVENNFAVIAKIEKTETFLKIVKIKILSR